MAGSTGAVPENIRQLMCGAWHVNHGSETISFLLVIAAHFGTTYTRYSDDLTFSTVNDFNREKAYELIKSAAHVLKKHGLFLNKKKTAVIPPGARKIVLGLLVNGKNPRLTRDFKGKIRQHLYYLEKLGASKHAEIRGFESIGGFYRYLRGMIDFANMVEPIYASECLRRLNSAKLVKN